MQAEIYRFASDYGNTQAFSLNTPRPIAIIPPGKLCRRANLVHGNSLCPRTPDSSVVASFPHLALISLAVVATRHIKALPIISSSYQSVRGIVDLYSVYGRGARQHRDPPCRLRYLRAFVVAGGRCAVF